MSVKNIIEKLSGLLVFIIALWTYTSTMEPTNSWWDCGEYIATAYKLQVGHPPGAPLFLLIANLFSHLSFGDVTKVALMINFMSALCSAATIWLLFSTIKHLACKFLKTEDHFIAVLGAMIGSLAYTFSDSFWFSAVEGEVYALSSFFTALVFWSIVKWSNSIDKNKKADKWLLFIAFLIGLSIGVHMLSLLVIPAIISIFYFKKFAPQNKENRPVKIISYLMYYGPGFIIANLFGVMLLGLIYRIIIPQFVNFAGKFELFFVNTAGLPFNSGIIIFFLLVILFIVSGLFFTRISQFTLRIISSFINYLLTNYSFYTTIESTIKYIDQKSHRIPYYFNLSILAFTFLLIGYMSFFTLIIRSNANTPIDENNPEDAVSLLSYLNREQYGSAPLWHGQFFSSSFEYDNRGCRISKDGNPVYVKDEKTNKYIISDDRKNSIPTYNQTTTGVFPRMWSSGHTEAYAKWANLDLSQDRYGNILVSGNKKPSFFQNLRFFFSYQIKHMYNRYFMWNFAGKQNDTQSHGEINNGNWLSGINFIDEFRLGPQKKLPDHLKNNKGRNTFYFLPLLLGLLGVLFHLTRKPGDAWAVFLLFFFTGLAIVIELNQTPFQPRERDYAYVGSFYAFAIWIGMGSIGIYYIVSGLIIDLNKNLKKSSRKLIQIPGLITMLLTLFIPFLMAFEGWDDHDRSDRYTAREFAKNYLKSCEPNAILFTMGDNDTFPLWYVQEVEGFRTDVRIINLSLLNTDWYIDQMKRDAYDGKAVPFSLEKDKYKQGTRDVALFYDGISNQINQEEAKLLKVYDYFRDGKISKEVYDSVEFSLTQKLNHLQEKQKNIHIISNVNEWIASDDKKTLVPDQCDSEKLYNGIPTYNISIPVDTNKYRNLYPKDTLFNLLDTIRIEIPKKTRYLEKKDLMILDLIEANNWDRPIYFAITIGSSGKSFLYLDKYFRLDGMVYKLMPVDFSNAGGELGDIGGVTTDILYPILMEEYEWGNLNGNIYLDETNRRMTMNFRNNFSRLAQQLLDDADKRKLENKHTDTNIAYKKAEKVLDRSMELMPKEKVPLNYFMHPMIDSYYKIASSIKPDLKQNKLLDSLTIKLFEQHNKKKTDNDPLYDLSQDNYQLEILSKIINPQIKSSQKKADQLTLDLYHMYKSELDYYFSFSKPETGNINQCHVENEIFKNLQFYNQLNEIAQKNNHPESLKINSEFLNFYQKWMDITVKCEN